MKIRMLICAAVALFAIASYSQEDAKTKTSEAVAQEKPVEQTPEQIAKTKALEALVEFLDVTKDIVRDGGEMARDGIKGGVEMAKKEIPEVLKEIVAVRRVSVVAYFISCVVIFVVFLKLGGKLIKMANSGDFGNDDSSGIGLLGLTLKYAATAIVVIVVLMHIRDWLLPWFAPRVYLIEYTMELIKKVR